MKKIKLKTSVILLLMSALGIAALVNFAQSQNGETFDDSRNIVRIFRLINSLNQEAEKQQAKGFEKRAEMLKNYFQRKTGISNEAKLKLDELAANFQKESENLNTQIKEVRKNQKNKPNDGALPYELAKLRESRNKLFEDSRQSLSNEVAKDDSEKVLTFLRKGILEKMKNKNKTRFKLDFNKEFQDLFKKTSFSEPSMNYFMEGYSWIDYDQQNNEVMSVSVTEADCEHDLGGDHDDRDNNCSLISVNSTLSSPESGLATDSVSYSGVYADMYLFAIPTTNGQYCVDATHQIETDWDYYIASSQSSDCTTVTLPTIDILWNGNSIKDTTQEAIVGQKIMLDVAVTNGTPTNQQWTIGGETLKNYEVICSGAQGQLGTTICDSPTSAVKTILSSSDLNQNQVNYYWWKAGEDLQVQVSVSVNGTPLTASVNFNVKSPTSNIVLVDKFGGNTRGPIFVKQVNGVWSLEHGDDLIEGIRLRHDTNFPSGISGETQWVQTYNLFHRFQKLDNTWLKAQREGVDLSYSYPPLNLQTLNVMRDTPNQVLNVLNNTNPNFDWKKVEVNDSAKTWVMFKPSLPDSIWVPLAAVNWTWNGIAIKQNDGSWVKDNEGVTGPTAINSLDFPIWDKNVRDFSYEPE